MILAALLALAAPAPTSAPIVLGMSYRWNSPVMHEERVVNVVLLGIGAGGFLFMWWKTL